MNSTNRLMIFFLLFIVIAMILVFGTDVLKTNSQNENDVNEKEPINNDEQEKDVIPKEQVLEQIQRTGFFEINEAVVDAYFEEISESITLTGNSLEFSLPKLTEEISWEILANEIYYSDSLQGYTSNHIEFDYVPGEKSIVDISGKELSDLRFSFWIVGERVNPSRTFTLTFSQDGDLEMIY